MIGHLYFSQLDPTIYRIWELGYIFNPKFHGKGFCTEAAAAILNYGFETVSAHKIVAYADPNNIASWKVLEKIGMKHEGLLRQNAFFKTDEKGMPVWHDCKVYGLVNEKDQMGI